MLEIDKMDPVNKYINSDLLETGGKIKDKDMELENVECNVSNVPNIMDKNKEYNKEVEKNGM